MGTESKPKLLLFDLDGTLLLTGGAGLRAISKLFKDRYGIENAMHKVEGRGITDTNIFLAIIERKLNRRPANGELQKLIEIYPRYLAPEVKTSPGYKIMSGIHEFLALLKKRGIYLALGTGNLEKTARIKLARAKLNRFFPVGGFATDAKDRDKLLRLAWKKSQSHYGVHFSRSNVYVIGDTPRDVMAARANGFVAVAVGCGMFPKKRLLASRPDFYFDGFDNPQMWLKKLKL